MNKLTEIMLIDDEEANNVYSTIIIEEQDCCDSITVFDSSIDALNELSNRVDQQSSLPDVIFVDLNMPKLNGWEFLEKYEVLKLDSYQNKPKVFILTTSNNPNDILKSKDYPSVSKFCEKPITDTLITEILAKSFN